MDRERLSGAVLALFGLASSSAISAYLAMHPEAENWVFYSGLCVSVLCLIFGTIIAFWSNKRAAGDTSDMSEVKIENVVIGGVNGGSWKEGIRVSGAPLDAKNVHIEAKERGFVVERGPNSSIRGSSAKSPESDGHVGYDLEDSPNSDLRGSTAEGYAKGYRLRRSGSSDLRDTKAILPSGKRVFSVKLPPAMEEAWRRARDKKD